MFGSKKEETNLNKVGISIPTLLKTSQTINESYKVQYIFQSNFELSLHPNSKKVVRRVKRPLANLINTDFMHNRTQEAYQMLKIRD